jgi:hypothetical protein
VRLCSVPLYRRVDRPAGGFGMSGFIGLSFRLYQVYKTFAARLPSLIFEPGCFAWYNVDQLRKKGMIINQYPRSESNRHWGPF